MDFHNINLSQNNRSYGPHLIIDEHHNEQLWDDQNKIKLDLPYECHGHIRSYLLLKSYSQVLQDDNNQNAFLVLINLLIYHFQLLFEQLKNPNQNVYFDKLE